MHSWQEAAECCQKRQRSSREKEPEAQELASKRRPLMTLVIAMDAEEVALRGHLCSGTIASQQSVSGQSWMAATPCSLLAPAQRASAATRARGTQRNKPGPQAGRERPGTLMDSVPSRALPFFLRFPSRALSAKFSGMRNPIALSLEICSKDGGLRSGCDISVAHGRIGLRSRKAQDTPHSTARASDRVK
jgi:hypothetical protein